MFAFNNICTYICSLLLFRFEKISRISNIFWWTLFFFYFTILNYIRLFRSSHSDYSTNQKYSATNFFLDCACPSLVVLVSGKYLWGIFVLYWLASPRSDFLQEKTTLKMAFWGVLLRLLGGYFKEHLLVADSNFSFWVLFFISWTKTGLFKKCNQ